MYQSENFFIPSSIEVKFLNPIQFSSACVSAAVSLTSPGWMGSNSFIASTPRDFSKSEIKFSKLIGLELPILNILCGAKEDEGSGFNSSNARFDLAFFLMQP